jgi:hypothetical protein
MFRKYQPVSHDGKLLFSLCIFLFLLIRGQKRQFYIMYHSLSGDRSKGLSCIITNIFLWSQVGVLYCIVALGDARTLCIFAIYKKQEKKCFFYPFRTYSQFLDEYFLKWHYETIASFVYWQFKTVKRKDINRIAFAFMGTTFWLLNSIPW